MVGSNQERRSPGGGVSGPRLYARHAERLRRFLAARPYLSPDVRDSIAFAIVILERLAEAAEAGGNGGGNGAAAEE